MPLAGAVAAIQQPQVANPVPAPAVPAPAVLPAPSLPVPVPARISGSRVSFPGRRTLQLPVASTLSRPAPPMAALSERALLEFAEDLCDVGHRGTCACEFQRI